MYNSSSACNLGNIWSELKEPSLISEISWKYGNTVLLLEQDANAKAIVKAATSDFSFIFSIIRLKFAQIIE
jgi:hypothetical protein